LGLKKAKAYKKLSMRQRLRKEGVKLKQFGKPLSGQKKVSLDRAVDRFIREASCRHGRSLGSPCISFDAEEEGVCKLDGHICDMLTAKGERYRLEYE
jgi:hypothetical protein